MWHVSSRSGVATLRTAIHLLLTYVLTWPDHFLKADYDPANERVTISQVIGCEDRLRNDLYCVGWGVKLYSNQIEQR